MRRQIIGAIAKVPGGSAVMGAGKKALYKVLGLEGTTIINDRRYNEHGLITDKNCDFIKEPTFIKSYEAALKQCPRPEQITSKWNLHVNQWAAYHAKHLEGDFVECGVCTGPNAMSNILYTDFASLNRKFFLFDTFCGLAPEFSTETEYNSYKDEYPDCYDFVVKSFSKFPNVVIVRGVVPKTLSQVNIQKVAYLSIDMNCALPELEALKFFWPKLVPGAVVVLDDYGWPGHEAQKEAIDGFCDTVGVKVLSLPIGQGLILKPSTSR